MNPNNAMRGLDEAASQRKADEKAAKRAVWRVTLKGATGFHVTTVCGTLRDVLKARKRSAIVTGYPVEIEAIHRAGPAA